jgi:hypothetical protein
MGGRRWVCPRCGGGVLAPGRPRRDDVRRYCLTCSARTGRLVPRVCPSLEAERQRRVLRQSAARERHRERERTAAAKRYMVDGLDLRKELLRLCDLPFVRAQVPERHRPAVVMTVSWSASRSWTTGHSKNGRMRIHLSLYHGCPRHKAQAVLAHELAHAILPSGVAHSERWRRTFARILADAYGLDELPATAMHGNKYELHSRVERALHAHDCR